MSLQKTGEWKLFLKLMTSSRFKSKLQTEVRKSIHASAGAIRGGIIEGIDQGKYAPNAALTIALKGSSTPLVDKGDLRRSIQIKVVSWDEGFAGLLATSGKANIGEILHEGATIGVTPKMRNWFKAQASSKGVKPLSPGTSTIVIPGRPFVGDVVESPAAAVLVKENFRRAVDGAFNDTSPGYITGM